MARRSYRNLRLVAANQKAAIEAEREKCAHMVQHFNRKGNLNTYWHTTLKRLDAALKQFEGDTENGE